MLNISLNFKSKHVMLKHMGENFELNFIKKNMGKYMAKHTAKPKSWTSSYI